MTGAGRSLILAFAAAPPQQPPPAAAEKERARDLVFLAENRPIFVRLRVDGAGPAVRGVVDRLRPRISRHPRPQRRRHAHDQGGRCKGRRGPRAAGHRCALRRPILESCDTHPKDGKVSIEELAEVLRPIIGPFQLQVGRHAIGRTDALFDQLDRDKDGELRRPELAAIAGSLRPLDLDDDEMISAVELEPYNSPTLMVMEESSDRRARYTAIAPVIELFAGESTLRPARLLLKKYDKGRGDIPGRTDNKLSPSEFGIDPDVFAGADKNGDDVLDTDELRKFLARAPIDLTLDVTLSPVAGGPATPRVEPPGNLPKGTQLRRLGDGDVEFGIGQVRLDVQVTDGNTVADEVRRVLKSRFKAADANKDGYLEGNELAAINAPQSPLAGLSEVIDRDGDGKIYLEELLALADRQIEAARSRLVVTTSDQGLRDLRHS